MGFQHLRQTIWPHEPEKGRWGDCHRTALAMALGLPALDVPNFVDETVFPEWRLARDAWLKERGLAAVEIPFDIAELSTLLTQLEYSCGDVPVLLAGYSERELFHETVVWRGKIYDPHPSDAGLIRPHEGGHWWVTLLCPLPNATPSPQGIANREPRRLGGKDAGANRGDDANATGTHDGGAVTP